MARVSNAVHHALGVAGRAGRVDHREHRIGIGNGRFRKWLVLRDHLREVVVAFRRAAQHRDPVHAGRNHGIRILRVVELAQEHHPAGAVFEDVARRFSSWPG